MISAGQATEIPLILKADVKGSIGPLRHQLEVFSTSEVLIKVLHAGVGAVTESDVLLAEASKAIIIGFHVSINDRIRSIVDLRGIDLRLYDVIYQAVDDIKGMVEGRHKPMEVEKITGHAEVRAVFKLSRGGSVAGCYMKDGVIARKDFARVQREGKVITDRIRISSIKRFKDDVKEVKEGFECGIKATGFDAWKEGDIIEGFSISLVQRKLEDVLVQEKKKKTEEE